MNGQSQISTALIAESDPDDRFFMKKALARTNYSVRLAIVEDGEEALDYLFRRGIYHHPETSPAPDFLLLDLDLPRLDGRDVLKRIRADKRTKALPVVVINSSKSDTDLMQCFNLGVFNYQIKPETFSGWVNLMRELGQMWIVENESGVPPRA